MNSRKDMPKDMSYIIEKLYAVIKRLRIDIVDLADKLGLGMFIPDNLRQWREYDFWYEYHVRYFLETILNKAYKEHDYVSLKLFLKELEEKVHKSNDYIVKLLFNEALRSLYSIVPLDLLQLPEIETIKTVDEVMRVNNELVKELLPEDIIEKAREMAKVYMYIYYVENFLRLFIKKVLESKYGDDYFSKINISKKLREKIEKRRNDAERNKWLPIRGNDDLFYLDIEDLGKIISNNWEHFKCFFPEMEWITQKIKEIQKIRNLVAHNSYIDETQRILLIGYYNQILRQIVGRWTECSKDKNKDT